MQLAAEQAWRDLVTQHLRWCHTSNHDLASTNTDVVELVEAAGVEPASADVTGQETTCLFEFRGPRQARKPSGVTIRHARSEPTRHASG